jgi:UDP-N-acetylmuramoyl-tripeptide--D-alanyl-D-alanine ligase
MATVIPENRARFSLLEVAEATGGVLFGDLRGGVEGVVSDSRRVSAGCLFVAIRGETHDGHAFASAAVKQGARAVLVDRAAKLTEPGARVEVGDTTTALGDLAAFHRKRWGGRLVAITGSAGKTTTKELVAAAIEGAGVRAQKTIGNLNNLVGVPHMLFTLDGSTTIAAIEVGTSKPGEIARLAEIARPNVGLVTCVAIAHTEGLGSLEAVALEKTSLLRAVETAIANRDDEMLWSHAVRVHSKPIGYGRHAEADVRLLERTLRSDLSTSIRVRIGSREMEAELALPGEGAALNATAAIAVADALGLDLDRAARALASVVPIPGRLAPVTAKNGALLLDDSYNANPASMRVAFETAGEIARATGRRLVGVAGDMKELGAESERAHRAVAGLAEANGAAELHAVGEAMAACVSPIATHYASADDVAFEPAPGDLVLVKGSRSMRMERLVARWKGEP